MFLSGKKLKIKTQSIKDKWIWYVTEVPVDKNPDIKLSIEKTSWKGSADIWVRTETISKGTTIAIKPVGQVKERTLPPLPYNSDKFKAYDKVVSFDL